MIGQVKQDVWGRKISLLIIIWFYYVMNLMLRCFLTNCSRFIFFLFFFFFLQLPWRLHKSCSGQSAYSMGVIQLNSLFKSVPNLYFHNGISEQNRIFKVKQQDIAFWYTLLFKSLGTVKMFMSFEKSILWSPRLHLFV